MTDAMGDDDSWLYRTLVTQTLANMLRDRMQTHRRRLSMMSPQICACWLPSMTVSQECSKGRSQGSVRLTFEGTASKNFTQSPVETRSHCRQAETDEQADQNSGPQKETVGRGRLSSP